MKSKTLIEIFNEAQKDYATTQINDTGYQACILLGVKITKEDMTGKITIHDPGKSINYYIEISQDAYKLFYKKGWKKAVREITLSKYKDKLERVTKSISREMNGGRSPKRLRTLKESRGQILRKYYKLSQK